MLTSIRRGLAVLGIAATLGAGGAAQAGPYSGIYFFGDSLTDVGNVHSAYAQIRPGLPPGSPAELPGAPYDPAGRASNGALYADVLAAGLGFSATPSVLGGNDWAYGGARTRYQVFGPPFQGVMEQVSAYTARPGPADAGALYVLWGGANNLQDILSGRTVDVLGNPIPGVGGTVSDLAAMINLLYADGVRSLLVPNAPNLGRVPRVAERGAAAQAGANQLVLGFNAALSTLLSQMSLAHPDLQIIRFDAYGALETVAAQPARYGLTNTTDRCYTGDDQNFTGGGTVCADPDQYLFWDGIHPTTAVHAILGGMMLEAVVAAAAVPEPGSAALVLLALGALAWRARAQRSRAWFLV